MLCFSVNYRVMHSDHKNTVMINNFIQCIIVEIKAKEACFSARDIIMFLLFCDQIILKLINSWTVYSQDPVSECIQAVRLIIRDGGENSDSCPDFSELLVSVCTFLQDTSSLVFCDCFRAD